MTFHVMIYPMVRLGVVTGSSLLLALSCLAAPEALARGGGHAEQDMKRLDGQVVSVLDGDTIVVLDATKQSHKIRLSGIDAPEKAQPFGQKSKAALLDLVAGASVEVRYEHLDRYGRTIGIVWKDGTDINLEMIHRGMAWHYVHYVRDQSARQARDYAATQIAAQSQKTGLWADPAPEPPWDFRKKKRNQSGKRK